MPENLFLCLSVQDAVKENLIEPIFIGDEKEINKMCPGS